MALQFTRKSLDEAQSKIGRLREQAKAIQRKGEQIAHKAVRTVEVTGTAFAFGVIKGKTGGVELFGVPLDLAVGIGAEIAGHLGAAGKMSDHLIAVGDGALASYATTIGQGVGAQWQAKGLGAGAPAAPAVRGEDARGLGNGGGMSASDLAAAARVVAAAGG